MKSKGSASLKAPELEELAEQIGSFIQYWGFKKIHGRIWAHLYVSSEPLDTAELMKRLKVSKALMSFSIRDLLAYDVIQEVSKGRHGTVYFRANPDLSSVIINVLRGREKKMMAQIAASQKLLRDMPVAVKNEFKIDSSQVQKLGEVIENASQALELFITMEGAGVFSKSPHSSGFMLGAIPTKN
jgi:DNA-binding transcriptional regulator GbsR (MarR family)